MPSIHLREELDRLHAEVCGALSDASRILILYTLAEKPQSVSELMQNVELSQPSVSRHLKVLRERNMVHSHREGQNVIYELSDRRVIEALDILRQVMADSFQSQVDLIRSAQEQTA
jgi:DNA-binding transcriptional ArsR family regulator